ncbi:MAG TPA: hypothetical protein PLM53_19115 [Spirochaetota bacterium]|nr:hypothetical protein [Spirochaetota bacterium]HPC39623.1 hypothetical protein [Spirochaetota bacterium]HPL16014.1 hypothetical protein [Spirochaetota bacterium]HQF07349.1 hypothetical protein [Spirochaetota bacterium]HQH99207.1 hypothetical protein [Spirochaetota bacterium]
MIVIFSTRLIRLLVPWFHDITGLTLFPFIIIRKEIRGTAESAVTLNHEKIHIRQQAELLLVVFAVWYAASFIAGRLRGLSWHDAYRNIIFEREAFDRMYDLDYLRSRKIFSFLNYRTKAS